MRLNFLNRLVVAVGLAAAATFCAGTSSGQPVASSATLMDQPVKTDGELGFWESMNDMLSPFGARHVVPPAPGDSMTLDEAWSVKGAWLGAATDPTTGQTYALRSGGRVMRFDRDGKQVGEIKLAVPQQDEDPTALRLANLVGDKAPALLVFRLWGDGVRAFDNQGKFLWEYLRGDGVDDVWAADLDGKNGFDSVIIGYNGYTGLHVLNADGTLRWEYSAIGDVWSVTAGPTGPGGACEVLATSAAGLVHVFDPAGNKIKDLRPGGDAGLVRLARTAPDSDPVIIADVGNDGNFSLVAINHSGEQLWRTPIGSRGANVTNGAAAPDKPWFAVAFMDGRVLVYDVRNGNRIASAKVGLMPSVAWLPAVGDKPTLLLSVSNSTVTASALRESAPTEPPRP